jgi:hypothetical protein
MKNRFGNREILCAGMDGLSPNIGGTGGVKPSTGTNTARPIELSALEAIGRIVGEAADRNNLSISGKLCTACHM